MQQGAWKDRPSKDDRKKHKTAHHFGPQILFLTLQRCHHRLLGLELRTQLLDRRQLLCEPQGIGLSMITSPDPPLALPYVAAEFIKIQNAAWKDVHFF